MAFYLIYLHLSDFEVIINLCCLKDLCDGTRNEILNSFTLNKRKVKKKKVINNDTETFIVSVTVSNFIAPFQRNKFVREIKWEAAIHRLVKLDLKSNKPLQ